MKYLFSFFIPLALLISSCQKNTNKDTNEYSRQQLQVDSIKLTLRSNKGSSNSFKVLSNVSWSISTSVTWLYINPVNGKDSATIQILANDANNTDSTRTGSIIITPPGNSSLPSKTIIVSQTGVTKEPALSFET